MYSLQKTIVNNSSIPNILGDTQAQTIFKYLTRSEQVNRVHNSAGLKSWNFKKFKFANTSAKAGDQAANRS